MGFRGLEFMPFRLGLQGSELLYSFLLYRSVDCSPRLRCAAVPLEA